ncbi:RcnB family protein [Limnobacter parvus]|uniref:RcnB family protein n=1 Tax=Limnobacter parvus TaxID=2939690 RepID=A0ABT1XN04_9BURK|nr:RcnB family protein [Limnobacter parvus]MCR2747933.1 RcnB family protein [Limnobacter parvus]
MTLRSISRPLAVAITALLIVSTSAYADKPEKGNGNSGNNGKNKSEQQEKRKDKSDKNEQVNFSFRSDDSRLIRDYYGTQAAKGKCPPGLAKKNNGCQPPGQAKKWQRGSPLPSDVRYYDIPNDLRLRLPSPPNNYGYVQTGTDVLLIDLGTRLVVDAIIDIL